MAVLTDLAVTNGLRLPPYDSNLLHMVLTEQGITIIATHQRNAKCHPPTMNGHYADIRVTGECEIFA